MSIGHHPRAKKLKQVQVQDPTDHCSWAIHYAIFEPEEIWFRQRTCVFSSAGGGFTMNYAESCVSAICKAEGIDWREAITFCDLWTHTGYTQRRGYYAFQSLEVGDEPNRDFRYKNGCNRIRSWHQQECPLAVFISFASLIGPFFSISELVDRIRPCYNGMSDEDYESDRSGSYRHLRWYEGQYLKYIEKHGAKLLQPDEALKKGYRLAPDFLHDLFPERFDDPQYAIVDLKESYLLGQYNGYTGDTDGVMGRPHPITLWRKLM